MGEESGVGPRASGIPSWVETGGQRNRDELSDADAGREWTSDQGL